MEDINPDKNTLRVVVEVNDGFFDPFEDVFALGIEVIEVDELVESFLNLLGHVGNTHVGKYKYR